MNKEVYALRLSCLQGWGLISTFPGPVSFMTMTILMITRIVISTLGSDPIAFGAVIPQKNEVQQAASFT